jgi:hypothetical protein
MDQSIASFAAEAPRRFLRDWVQTVLWPGLGCGGFAVAVVSNDLRFEDWIFIFILGTPVLYWLIVGLLQGRVLRALIERPRVWAVSTWGGGSLALIAGFATFGWLSIWIDAISHAGFDPEHPYAMALFAFSGVVAGLVLGFLQAVTMRATWRERLYWLAWSAGAGAVAFLVQWAGVNALSFMSGQGTIDVTETAFFATIAGFLLASALAHNVLTGIALQRMLAKRAKRNQNALIGQFD